MKKLNFNAFCIFVLSSFIFLLFSCSKNDEEQTQASRMTVRMTDAPGDYDEVNIEILDVLIKNNSDINDQGWVSIGTGTPQVYNLLNLTGDVNALLADHVIASGQLGQIRLVLGDHNTVVKDGVTYPLKTPSAQQSGLKLKINQMLLPGITYDFLLDFDVHHSIVVEAGNSGNFNLIPVIRVATTSNSGSIKGTVTTTPAGVQVLASVDVDGVAVSAFTDENGKFQINGIPAGTYTVTLTPDAASGLAIAMVPNVIVVNGKTTDIGSQMLP